MSRFPLPQQKRGWQAAIILIIFSFLLYYPCLYTRLENSYYGHFWKSKVYHSDDLSITFRIPQYVSSFIEREIIISVENLEKKPIDVTIIISATTITSNEPVLLQIQSNKTSNDQNILEGSSAVHFFSIPARATDIKSVWVRLPITQSDDILFHFFRDTAAGLVGLDLKDKTIARTDSYCTLLQSLIKTVLLPPWSNGFLPALALIIAWSMEESMAGPFSSLFTVIISVFKNPKKFLNLSIKNYWNSIMKKRIVLLKIMVRIIWIIIIYIILLIAIKNIKKFDLDESLGNIVIIGVVIVALWISALSWKEALGWVALIIRNLGFLLIISYGIIKYLELAENTDIRKELWWVFVVVEGTLIMATGCVTQIMAGIAAKEPQSETSNKSISENILSQLIQAEDLRELLKGPNTGVKVLTALQQRYPRLPEFGHCFVLIEDFTPWKPGDAHLQTLVKAVGKSLSSDLKDCDQTRLLDGLLNLAENSLSQKTGAPPRFMDGKELLDGDIVDPLLDHLVNTSHSADRLVKFFNGINKPSKEQWMKIYKALLKAQEKKLATEDLDVFRGIGASLIEDRSENDLMKKIDEWSLKP